MDSLTLFHSKNVYFYLRYSYSLKIMALSIFQNFWVDTSLKQKFSLMYLPHVLKRIAGFYERYKSHAVYLSDWPTISKWQLVISDMEISFYRAFKEWEFGN